MAAQHPTVEPEQTKTDTWAVFADVSPGYVQDRTLGLAGRVEVPRFSQPTDDGVRLSRDKRLALAVNRAMDDATEGKQFWVMTDLVEDLEWATYEENPAFDGVWDPQEEEA